MEGFRPPTPDQSIDRTEKNPGDETFAAPEPGGSRGSMAYRTRVRNRTKPVSPGWSVPVSRHVSTTDPSSP